MTQFEKPVVHEGLSQSIRDSFLGSCQKDLGSNPMLSFRERAADSLYCEYRAGINMRRLLDQSLCLGDPDEAEGVLTRDDFNSLSFEERAGLIKEGWLVEDEINEILGKLTANLAGVRVQMRRASLGGGAPETNTFHLVVDSVISGKKIVVGLGNLAHGLVKFPYEIAEAYKDEISDQPVQEPYEVLEAYTEDARKQNITEDLKRRLICNPDSLSEVVDERLIPFLADLFAQTGFDVVRRDAIFDYDETLNTREQRLRDMAKNLHGFSQNPDLTRQEIVRFTKDLQKLGLTLNELEPGHLVVDIDIFKEISPHDISFNVRPGQLHVYYDPSDIEGQNGSEVLISLCAKGDEPNTENPLDSLADHYGFVKRGRLGKAKGVNELEAIKKVNPDPEKRIAHLLETVDAVVYALSHTPEKAKAEYVERAQEHHRRRVEQKKGLGKILK